MMQAEKVRCGNCYGEGVVKKSTRTDYTHVIECKKCGFCCTGPDLERLIKHFEEERDVDWVEKGADHSCGQNL